MDNGFYRSECGYIILHTSHGLKAPIEFRNKMMCELALRQLNNAKKPRGGWCSDKISREINKLYRMVRCPNSTCYGSSGEGKACKRPSEHVKWGDDACAARKDRFDEWLMERKVRKNGEKEEDPQREGNLG